MNLHPTLHPSYQQDGQTDDICLIIDTFYRTRPIPSADTGL